MIETISISLSITRQCNAACRHCGVDGTARIGPAMSQEAAAGYVRAAASLGTLRSVAITGGEPMLFPGTIRAILAEARQLGLWGELVSNSSFAVTAQAADKALEPLVRLGLRKYVTSLDRFHLEFIPGERVAHAVRAARGLGVEVIIKTLAHGNEAVSRDEMESLLGQDVSGVEIQRFALVRSGRARDIGAGKALHRRWPGACNKVIRFPSLTAEGHLYGCCSFGDAARVVGNVAEAPLPRLLERMQHMLLLQLIAWKGPQGIVDMAVDMGFSVPPDGFQGPCDLCTALWEQPELRQSVASILENLVDSQLGRVDMHSF